MARDREVLVTGLGIVLPHGSGLGAAEAVFEGRSAVRRLPEMPGLPDATGAPVADFVPPRGVEGADRAIQFAVAAAEEAMAEAGFSASDVLAGRIATVISLSKGAIHTLCQLAETFFTSPLPWGERVRVRGQVYPLKALSPSPHPSPLKGEGVKKQPLSAGVTFSAGVRSVLTAHGAIHTPLAAASADAAARAAAQRLGLAGPLGSPVAACASGGHALAWGATLIRRGVVDAAVVGAAEASLHPLVLGSYRRMGVLAAGGADPASSVRPFSVTRRGFAIGEGAGVLVLESAAGAARRRARPLARIASWATGCQAVSLTDMEPAGASLARLMSEALRRARVQPAAVDYIHAHGAATVHGDLAEARAIRAALGKAADAVSVSSTKGAHGHLLGAATAVELVLTVLAMQRGCVPPTANLTDPDPAIALDCTPLTPRRRDIRRALKIASGFGGQMVAVVLEKP